MKITRQTKRAAKRLFRLCQVNGQLDDERILKVVQSIIKANRRGGLALLTYFQRLVKLDSAKHVAKVESAIPLSPELRKKIQNGLTRIYGPAIQVSFMHKPELIGGTRIKIGSDFYDGSVRGRLDALEKTF